MTADDGGPAGEAGGDATGGILYVVATPIGNLGDMTHRAVDVLGAVAIIAAEDTRLSRRLLDRYGIPTRMTSYHAHSGPARLSALLERLRTGEDVALITDAGTPIVSDPGADLVAAWAGEGGTVVPIPGASAVLAAVAGSGVAGPRWTFEGFLPRSGRERKDRLAVIAADPRGTVLYEAPGRVAATLQDLATACGAARGGAVCRELTKRHESITRGSLGELAAAAADGSIPPRGEFSIVVAMGVPSQDSPDVAETVLAAARAEVDRLVADGAARGDAARQVSAATGIPRRQLY